MDTNANLFHVGDQDFESNVLKADAPLLLIFGQRGVVLVVQLLLCLSV